MKGPTPTTSRVDAGQILAQLRTPGTPAYRTLRERIASESPERAALMRLARHEFSPDTERTAAIRWLSAEPSAELSDFYRERLVAVTDAAPPQSDAGRQGIELVRALALSGEERDLAAVARGISWLVASPDSPDSLRLGDYSYSRIVVATIALAERGGNGNHEAVAKVANFSEARRRSANGEVDYQNGAVLFAAEYARRRLAGETSSSVLKELFTSDTYTVRVPAMNGLRHLGAINVPDVRLYETFPFRDPEPRRRYVDHVFKWMLQNVGVGHGRVPAEFVVLPDGSHPEGPVTDDAELERLGREKLGELAAQSRIWPTTRVRSIESNEPLYPLLETKLGDGELVRDRRLFRPVVGGPL